MKKFICLLLAMLMILSAVACSNDDVDNKDTTGAENSDVSGSDAADETDGDAFVPSYTGVFKVGYDRIFLPTEISTLRTVHI